VTILPMLWERVVLSCKEDWEKKISKKENCERVLDTGACLLVRSYVIFIFLLLGGIAISRVDGNFG